MCNIFLANTTCNSNMSFWNLNYGQRAQFWKKKIFFHWKHLKLKIFHISIFHLLSMMRQCAINLCNHNYLSNYQSKSAWDVMVVVKAVVMVKVVIGELLLQLKIGNLLVFQMRPFQTFWLLSLENSIFKPKSHFCLIELNYFLAQPPPPPSKSALPL